MASEKNPQSILSFIGKHIQPHQRIFVGVINSCDRRVETAEEVRDRVLEAAKHIPIAQLGTTDDCGFAPYDNDETFTREKCFEKIRARIEGTKMAEEILNQSPQEAH